MDELYYGAVALRLCTGCGAGLIVGGLCKAGNEQECVMALYGLSELTLTGIVQPDELDKVLARAIYDRAPETLWAAGASVCVNAMVYSSGGVLGNPHISPCDASREVDDIGNGLFLLAQPGGPGLIITAESLSSAKDSFRALREMGVFDRKHAYSIGEYLDELDLDAWIVVTDGSGTNTRGQLAVFAGGEDMTLSL